ncbi:hypothetical protein [Sphingomonas oryzagri]
MIWISRLLLFIPSIVAGWFVSEQDARYWVIALVVGLVFLAVSSIAVMYWPILLPAGFRRR